jgi:hypothetical protein
LALTGANDLLKEVSSPDPPAPISPIRQFNPAAVGAGADIPSSPPPANQDDIMSEAASSSTDNKGEETPLPTLAAPSPEPRNPEPPKGSDGIPPDAVMETASNISWEINALSSAIEDLDLENYDDSFALLLPLAREVQDMQHEQSVELQGFSSPVTDPFDIPFAAGADELAPALHTAATIDGSRGRIAAMNVVLARGAALVETERCHTKTLQDLMNTLTQITDREKALSAKTKSLQEKTAETTKTFLESLVFLPNMDFAKNEHIRGRCAALENSIDKSLAEY